MTAVAPHPSRVPAPADKRGGSTWHAISPLVVSVVAAALAVGTYLLFVRTPVGQVVDTETMRGGDVDHPRIVEVLSRTLNGTQLASLALVCVLAFAFGALRRRLDLSIAAAITVVGANLTAQWLKGELTRPDLDGFPLPNSFPGGHTAAAASVAFVLVLVFPRALRGFVGLAGAAYVAVVSVATVWAEWHRPSDAIAAVLIVLAWGSLAVWGVRLRLAGTTRPLHLPNRLVMVVLGITAGVTAAVGLIGVLAVALSERAVPDFVSGRYAFSAGAASIVAVVAGAFIIWIRLTAVEPPAGRPAGRPVQGGTT